MDDSDLHDAIARFVGAFEQVFERDWGYSKMMLTPANVDLFIRPNATFLNPGVVDEEEDWGARAELLEQYRKLLHVMARYCIKPKKPW